MIELSVAAAVLYAGIAAVALARMPPTDNEAWYTGVASAREAALWALQFGTPMPRRQPFRLPVEFALWRWAPSLRAARVVGIAWGMALVAGCVAWAHATAGWQAGMVTAGVLLTNRTLVTLCGTASYVSLVGGLWCVGVGATLADWPALALAAAVALAWLRASAWGMAAVLFALAGPLGWALGLGTAGVLIWRFPDVVAANGWVRWVRREPCPVAANPSWAYALSVAVDRYATVGVWLGLALWWGREGTAAPWVLAWTALAYLLAHLPRLRLSPKWAIGYWPEHAPAVAVAVGWWLA